MIVKKERIKDRKLEQLFIRRNLSTSRKRGYYRVFETIQEQFGYTPTQLLEIAKDEQKPRSSTTRLNSRTLKTEPSQNSNTTTTSTF